MSDTISDSFSETRPQKPSNGVTEVTSPPPPAKRIYYRRRISNAPPPPKRIYYRRRIPNERGRYQCPHCPRDFSTSHGLSSHMRVHIPKEPQDEVTANSATLTNAGSFPTAGLMTCAARLALANPGTSNNAAPGANPPRQHDLIPTSGLMMLAMQAPQNAGVQQPGLFSLDDVATQARKNAKPRLMDLNLLPTEFPYWWW